jgi:hypothetical protein
LLRSLTVPPDRFVSWKCQKCVKFTFIMATTMQYDTVCILVVIHSDCCLLTSLLDPEDGGRTGFRNINNCTPLYFKISSFFYSRLFLYLLFFPHLPPPLSLSMSLHRNLITLLFLHFSFSLLSSMTSLTQFAISDSKSVPFITL